MGNIQSVFEIPENWSLGLRRAGHWGSQVGGSLTNCLLMVATVSAGGMGEVSGAKQSSRGGRRISCGALFLHVSIPPYNFHRPTLPAPGGRSGKGELLPSCLVVSALECFMRNTIKCQGMAKFTDSCSTPRSFKFWTLINSSVKLPCCPGHPWRRLT